jgi:P4 family phage/plasmid primase-like protien
MDSNAPAMPDRSKELVEVLALWGLNKSTEVRQTPPQTASANDTEDRRYIETGLNKDSTLRALYDGERPKGNESDDDLSFMNKLAHWCNNNAALIEEQFFLSPYYQQKDAFHAKKCKRKGYMARLINKAITGTPITAKDKDAAFKANQAQRQPIAQVKTKWDIKPTDYSDVGEAVVFAKEYLEHLKFCTGVGFLMFDGQRWLNDEITALGLLQFFTSSQKNQAWEMLRKAKSAEEQEAAREFLKFILRCRGNNRMNGILHQTKPTLAIPVSSLDADGLKLNTPAGTVDLRTGELLPHSPGDYCTKITAIGPLTNEKLGQVKTWNAFLEAVTCSDTSLADYLQLVIGACAVGKVYAENLIIAHGGGRNGKSTFFNVIARILGDYSVGLSAELLTMNQRLGKPYEIAELRGKRIVIAAELEEGTRLNTSMAKKLCSTDMIHAEKKYKDPFDFIPSHTVVLYTNHLPRVGTSDAGTWRRLVVIPFKAKFEGSADIKNYADYLFNNAGEAILSWIIEGAKRFIAAGGSIEQPQRVKEAIADYRAANDWLSEFIADCCETSPQFKEGAGKLYEVYLNYCINTNAPYKRQVGDFKDALEKAGYIWRKEKRGNYYYGLQIVEKDIPPSPPWSETA